MVREARSHSPGGPGPRSCIRGSAPIVQAPLNPVSIDYDAANRRTTVTYPDGSVVSHRFTPRGSIDRVMLDAQMLSTREFDAGGRLIENRLGNGLVETTSNATPSATPRIEIAVKNGNRRPVGKSCLSARYKYQGMEGKS